MYYDIYRLLLLLVLLFLSFFLASVLLLRNMDIRCDSLAKAALHSSLIFHLQVHVTLHNSSRACILGVPADAFHDDGAHA